MTPPPALDSIIAKYAPSLSPKATAGLKIVHDPTPAPKTAAPHASAGAKFSPTFDETRRYFEARLGVSLPAHKEVPAKCPFHDDRTASMSLNLEKGTWFCHACNEGGGILDFERKLTGKDDAECWAAINATIGRVEVKSGKPSHGPIVATYDYQDAAGKLVYQALRYEQPKDFRQRRPDGKGGFTWNMDGVTRVPFNLPALVRANVVLIPEGEKDALNLQKAAAKFPTENDTLSYAATCNVGGAGKWLDEYSKYLPGKRVIVFQDCDKAGREHAQQVCASVSKYAQAVQLVELPGLAEHGDVSDLLEKHTPIELFTLMQTAPVWTAPVTAPKPSMTLTDAAGITVELLKLCRAWIRRFVVLGDFEVTILACWLLHTWAFAAAVVTPYLHVHSPEKGSGKTTLLMVLRALARGPRFSSGISAAALARVVAKDRPTLFIDELDAQMRGDKEKAQDIRGVLDGGFDINGTYTRCVGKDFEVRDFPTFCPKVLAGIGELWDTVESRSISIEMRRRLPSEKVEAFRQRRVEKDALPIREALQAWAGSFVELLEQIEVIDVPGLNDRQMDISESLLQIAQLAGDDQAFMLAAALMSIFKISSVEDGSIGTILLNDIRITFEDKKADRMFSKDLADALCALEGRPWQDWANRNGLTANRLAKLLHRFHIISKTIDIKGVSLKGYEAKDFYDAFSRYLSPIQNVETSKPAPALDETLFSKRRTVEEPTFQKVPQTPVTIDVRRFDVSKKEGQGVRV